MPPIGVPMPAIGVPVPELPMPPKGVALSTSALGVTEGKETFYYVHLTKAPYQNSRCQYF